MWLAHAFLPIPTPHADAFNLPKRQQQGLGTGTGSEGLDDPRNQSRLLRQLAQGHIPHHPAFVPHHYMSYMNEVAGISLIRSLCFRESITTAN